MKENPGSKESNPHNPVLKGLLKRRTVVLNGRIDHTSIARLAGQMLSLQEESNEEIKLIINSGGGDIRSALQLCDLIKIVLTAPVCGIALGDCGSAATFIMLHCAKRLSSQNSRFLIHSARLNQVSFQINQTTSKNLEDLTKEVQATEEKVLKIYTEYLKPLQWKIESSDAEEKRKYVQSLIDRGDQQFNDWFSAEEALEIGLVDEIKTENLGIYS